MRLLVCAVAIALVAGCDSAQEDVAASASASGNGAGPPIGPPETRAAPRKGMAWIPPGALVAGTPPNQLPRIADEEMPGLQLMLKGFYIDLFAYPNEEGALPLTNVTQLEAAKLCEERDKRLCSELEWERACKGPNNLAYEYGDRYRAEACGTGADPKLIPSGFRAACKSEFGVADLHGGIWEWTDSPWGRGRNSEQVSLRGGNSSYGPVVGRCANSRPRDPAKGSAQVGFRCCGGPRNPDEVALDIGKKRGLETTSLDKDLLSSLLKQLPESAKEDLARPGAFRIYRSWRWRPVGNDDLIVLAGCSPRGRSQDCGILVGRTPPQPDKLLTWVSSGAWFPSLHPENNPRDVWMLGGDIKGRFKRRLAYSWGEVRVGDKDWRVPKAQPRSPRKANKKAR